MIWKTYVACNFNLELTGSNVHYKRGNFTETVLDRTNEVYLPMNRVNSDRLPVKAEAHQSWIEIKSDTR